MGVEYSIFFFYGLNAKKALLPNKMSIFEAFKLITGKEQVNEHDFSDFIGNQFKGLTGIISGNEYVDESISQAFIGLPIGEALEDREEKYYISTTNKEFERVKNEVTKMLSKYGIREKPSLFVLRYVS